jgi:hypothetical protein
MAIKTVCQTPGAQFHTKIDKKSVEVKVDLPNELKLSKKQAKILDSNLHNALELVLATYFVKKSKRRV